jgi:hypothetical protein
MMHELMQQQRQLRDFTMESLQVGERSFPDMFPDVFPDVFPECSLNIHKCSLGVPWMFTQSSLEHLTCSLNVP